MVSNIDFLPTFLDLAGIAFSEQEYDGRSLQPILERDGDGGFDHDEEWRQSVLIEYRTIKGTVPGIGIQKCVSWDPDSRLPAEGAVTKVNADIAGDWTTDNMWNNFRALMLKNESVDWMYAEFVDDAWNEEAFSNPLFYEFFDLNTDPFELHNVYHSALSDSQREQLKELVAAFGECVGADSCSPIGAAPPGQPLDAGDDDVDGDGGGAGKGDKGRKNKNDKAVAPREPTLDDTESSSFNPYFGDAQIVLILCFGVVALLSLGMGIFIGNMLQRPETQNSPKM